MVARYKRRSSTFTGHTLYSGINYFDFDFDDDDLSHHHRCHGTGRLHGISYYKETCYLQIFLNYIFWILLDCSLNQTDKSLTFLL